MAFEGSKTAAALALVGLFAACSSTGDGRAPSVADEGSLARAFASSAEKSGVPRDLLVAIAKVEDGLTMPAERLALDEDAAVPAAGPLMLRRGRLDTLARGAQLARVTEMDLRRSADLALEAGAMVLAELGRKTGARAGDLASWKTAIEEMGGYADDLHRDEYAHRVFATLARGGTFDARDGEKIVLPRHDLPPTLTVDVSDRLKTLAGAQYPGAQFFPTSCASSKCNTSRAGAAIQYIVIHDTEGGWDASVATLQNDPGKSVQYIVNTDGKVGQFVDESVVAYHAGNYHYNQRSVGIEHVGYATKPYPEAQYAASAKLVDYLAKKYNVKRDRAHIIGHDQIPNGTRISESGAPCSDSPKGCEANVNYGGAAHHTDPGVWEWAGFMARIGASAKCNDVTNLLNCSNDKKQAWRCVGDKVEVLTCDGPNGCQTKPNGQDDVCDVKPKTEPPPTGTGPTSPTDPPGTSETSVGPGGATTPGSSSRPDPTSASDEPSASDSGCSASGSSSGGGGAPIALAIAFGLVLSRRTRRTQ
jgi:uncharacterized protein (TIGR03382 family)